MSNSRKWTTDHNATNRALDAFVKARAGRSITKRREAVQRAVTMPNRLPPSTRASLTAQGKYVPARFREAGE
jgi:hypothetical protein